MRFDIKGGKSVPSINLKKWKIFRIPFQLPSLNATLYFSPSYFILKTLKKKVILTFKRTGNGNYFNYQKLLFYNQDFI